MNVLHVHWRPPQTPGESGAIYFWAETTKNGPPARKVDRRRRTAQPHPFALNAAQVQARLAALTGLPVLGEPDAITLRLPTLRMGPQPSPGLVQDWDMGRDAPILRAWRIPALKLTPADALYAFLNLPVPEDLPHDLHLGDDLIFWQTAARLGLEALARQKVQPALIQGERDQTLYARWTPVLDAPRDGPRLARLEQAMPPLARAGEIQRASPRFLIDSFLAGLTDDLMRRWGQGLIVEKRGRSPDPWLVALTSRQPELPLSAAQARRLWSSYRAWLRNLHVAGDAHFRVALRLEPPSSQREGHPDDWVLHYLLQSRDDPSLLIDAAEIWREHSPILHQLSRRPQNPQELLLTGLGFVARHCPPVHRSLRQKHPAAAIMSAEEAYAYLRETAPLLETSGFGVLTPPWWNKARARLGVRMKMKARTSSDSGGVSKGMLSMENLVQYRWELSLGGEPLSREEFEALVALKSPLVRIRGQWVQLDPEQIEAAIRFWEKMAEEEEIGLLDAAAIALGGEAEVEGLPMEGVEAEGWLEDWLARFKGEEKLEILPPPAGLSATLRPYQTYGYSWLDFQRRFGVGACLADDMGLGKTIQTLAMLQRLKEHWGSLPAPSLLVAPTSVVVNWAREAERFTPDLRVLVHHGPNRLRDEAFVEAAGAYDLVATSYALVRRDEATLGQIDWFGVILDEAQNIKNPDTRQARAVRQLPSAFRLALTGTPVENRLSELWSIMHFLNPGFLGGRRRFRQQFALPIERYGDEEAAQRLRRLVSPFILRRVKTDPTVIQDLPEKQETKVYCFLTPEQATLYEAVVQEAMQAIDSEEGDMRRRGMVLAMLMKLKQICNHPAQFLHQMEGEQALDNALARSGKLARLVQLLDELLAAGDRALIFTQFSEMGGFLQTFLQQYFGRPVLFLHGGVPARKRQALVDRFQSEEGPPIFVLSLKAGGTGLNLTRASHVFHFDRWWNPAVEDQATDRAFRIGQKKNVQVHKFVSVGTLEEKIDAMLEEKKALAQAIVGSGENWLTELSTAELRELVQLRQEMTP